MANESVAPAPPKGAEGRGAKVYASIRAAGRKGLAAIWFHFFRWRFWTQAEAGRRAALAIVMSVAAIIAASIWALPSLQAWLAAIYPTERSLDVLRDVMLAVGAALVGATAFAFSLVMFAMQVNVERMPHGLFRKFSSDPWLMTCFLLSFFAALAVASLPLMLSVGTVALTTLLSVWGAVGVLGLFLIAYARALRLISPSEQLRILATSAQKDLRRWRRIGERVRARYEPAQEERAYPPSDRRADIALATFYAAHPQWTARALQAINYAVAYSRLYDEQRDREVANLACQALLAINASYIKAKGATFFAQQLFGENPLVTDGVVNATLEHLKQNIRLAVARGDEPSVSQNVATVARVAELYLSADYGAIHNPKTHAYIARGYLFEALQSVAPHAMPDVLLRGVELMGDVGRGFISAGQLTDFTACASDIFTIGAAGVARPDHKPVTLQAFQQFARLNLLLFAVREPHDVSFAMSSLRKAVFALATLVLETPDQLLSAGHQWLLEPYFSGTFLASSEILVQATVADDATPALVAQVLSNLEAFSDGLYAQTKDLFLKSIERDSSFTMILMHWIESVTTLLWAVAEAKSDDSDVKENLRSHGRWLASVLSWVPKTNVAVGVVEKARMTDTLFRLSVEAENRVDAAMVDAMNNLQMGWGLKSARHGGHWGTLDNSMCALAVMAVRRGDEAAMVGRITAAISAAPIAPETADRAAREIRRRARRLWDERSYSELSQAMRQSEHSKLEPALNAVADAISPGTKSEVINDQII